MSIVKDLMHDFESKIRHAIRQELIRELAGTNGVRLPSELPATTEPAFRTAKRGKRSRGTVAVRRPPAGVQVGKPLSPADIIGHLPARCEELAKMFSVTKYEVQPTLSELMKQGIIHKTGAARGTMYHRTEPVVEGMG